jgi:DNA-binding transcriptional ArsR family regulator
VPAVPVVDVAVLEDPRVAAVALEPTRARLLAELAAAPASAAGLASATGLPRQRLGHHLKALEDAGLVVEVDRRRHGGLTERILAATAAAYVVSPAAMGAAAADPTRVRDRLSAAYAVAVAARAVRELGALVRGAAAARGRVPTLTVDTDIRFASAADRAAFADDLAAAVRALAARYHDEDAPGGRWYRLVALSHPRPRPEEDAP